MKFLDLNGLKHLLTKIKANFGTAIINNSAYLSKKDDSGRIIIPFVANHQIVRMDAAANINVYDWFQKASIGGILEIVFAGAQGGYTYCYNNGKNYMMKMVVVTGPTGPSFTTINVLETAHNTYARLIKMTDEILTVAEFVQNK